MAESPAIIVDTNILFSALLRQDSRFTRAILNSGSPFYVCESILIELFRHKERIVHRSKLTEDEVVRLLYLLLRQVTAYREEMIDPEVRSRALALCRDVDPADASVVALTLHLNGVLWTGDLKLKNALQAKGFTAFYELPA